MQRCISESFAKASGFNRAALPLFSAVAAFICVCAPLAAQNADTPAPSPAESRELPPDTAIPGIAAFPNGNITETVPEESSLTPLNHSTKFDVAPNGGFHSDSEEFNQVNDEIVSAESPLTYDGFFGIVDKHGFNSGERLMLWQVLKEKQHPPISAEGLKSLYAQKCGSINDLYTIFRIGEGGSFIHAFKGRDMWYIKSDPKSKDKSATLVRSIYSVTKSDFRKLEEYIKPWGRHYFTAQVIPFSEGEKFFPPAFLPQSPIARAWLTDPSSPRCAFDPSSQYSIFEPSMPAFLDKPAAQIVFEKPETLNGHVCLVVGNFNTKLYLDAEKDYSVYSVETYQPAFPGGPTIGPGRCMSQKVILHGLKDYGNGVWLPSSVESIMFNPDGTVKNQENTVYDEIKVNSGLEDSLFTDFISIRTENTEEPNN